MSGQLETAVSKLKDTIHMGNSHEFQQDAVCSSNQFPIYLPSTSICFACNELRQKLFIMTKIEQRTLIRMFSAGKTHPAESEIFHGLFPFSACSAEYGNNMGNFWLNQCAFNWEINIQHA